MYEFAVECFTEILKFALPIAFVFGFGNFIVTSLLSAIFGGRLWAGRL